MVMINKVEPKIFTRMKNIKNIYKLLIVVAVGFMGMFTSCKEEADLQLPYLFRPINFNVELNKTVATVSWAAVDSAVSYTFQISQDSLFNSTIVDTTLTQLSYVKELAGETKFFARIRANANDATKSSKFNSKLSFKTPAENIFLGYGTNTNVGKLYSAYMTDVNSLTVKWKPGSNATHFILVSADLSKKDSVIISSAEALAGVKVIPALSNSIWTAKIYNKKILRGTTTGTVEGDIVLSSGADLPLAISNATSGQIILLAPGVVYPMGTATVRFGKNVKVRGLSATNRSVLCMATGASTTGTSSMLGFADASTINFVKFENVDFTGYADNNVNAVKIGYLFNNNLLTNVKTLSFDNCNLHNFGNTPMRVQGGKNQIVDTLSFNGCVINDIGFASTYAIVNSNSADFVNTIRFNNCTVYNFKGSLVSRTTQTLNSISITNCTFNQGMQDPSSVRFFIDTNTATFTGSGITIKNCVFGSSGGTLGGAGIRTTGTLAITGSYYTSDYVDQTLVATVSYSRKSLMTSYAKPSTELWSNPTTGNFSFKDATFVGKGVVGDLRW